MGGLTFLFAFEMNAIIGAVIAGIVSVIAAVLPQRRLIGPSDAEPWSRRKRALLTFLIVWLSFMAYGCVYMFGTHNYELNKTEAAGKVPGLIGSLQDVLKAEQIAHGDTAQTYLLVQTTSSDVEHAARINKLRAAPFDAQTVHDRGWPVPAWWPTKACPGGITYNDDPAADPPTFSEYVINWCPSEGKAFVQHFDY